MKGSTSQKGVVKVVGRLLFPCNSNFQKPEAVSTDGKTVISALPEPLQSQAEDVTFLCRSCWLLCWSCNRGLRVCHQKCVSVSTLDEKSQRGTSGCGRVTWSCSFLQVALLPIKAHAYFKLVSLFFFGNLNVDHFNLGNNTQYCRVDRRQKFF